MRCLIGLFFIVFFTFSTHASNGKNVLFISIDGLSRDTLYALINKREVPNIQRVISRGNYRNMELPISRPNTLQVYHALLSGQLMANTSLKIEGDPIAEGDSIFERLESQIPNLTTVSLISEPLHESSVPQLDSLLLYANDRIDIPNPVRRRTLNTISRRAKQILTPLEAPFFMFMNYTNVDYVGRKYREGSSTYSTAVKRVDYAIGELISILKTNGLWQDTEVILTTQNGYRKNSQILSSKIWVASTQKTRFKGSSLDIVPTIYTLYGINPDGFNPRLQGSTLTKDR